MKPYILNAAIEQAKLSTYIHRMGCVIFNKKTIISLGRNFSFRPNKIVVKVFCRWPGSIHAEVDAILNARSNLHNMSLLVVRINKRQKLRLAKPCPYCLAMIQYSGIKKIFYSTNLETLERL